MEYPVKWTCPVCGSENNNTETCNKCTFPVLWDCPKCSYTNHKDMVCANCNYHPLNPEKSGFKIKKSYLLIGAGIIYLIIMGFIVFNLLTNDKIQTAGELLISNNVSIAVWIFNNPDSVSFDLTNPYGEFFSCIAESNGSNVWVANVIFEKSGMWDVVVQKTYGNSVVSSDHELRIYEECTLDSHCEDKGADYKCDKNTGFCVESASGGFNLWNTLIP